MDVQQAEKVGTLAKSLYTNRLVASMDDAYRMAENILSKSAAGEARSVKDIAPSEVVTEQAAYMPKKQLKVEEHSTNTVKSDLTRVAALKRVVLEEEQRIGLLKAELADLKENVKKSGQTATGVDSELAVLEKDIDAAKQDITHIRQHIHDLEEIKQEVKEVEESQEKADAMAEQAEEAREQTGKWANQEP